MPLLAMSFVAALFILRDKITEGKAAEPTGTLKLDSPISLKKVSSFGLLLILIQIGGTLLTRLFGSYGLLATGLFGGLASSASTTAAAATMAMHGKITASLAGSVTIISSLASAIVNLPIVWKTIQDKQVVKRLTIEIMAVIIVGIAVVVLDRIFLISDILFKH
jgi:uncharacterized membrane protein (DUF4010 family)